MPSTLKNEVLGVPYYPADELSKFKKKVVVHSPSTNEHETGQLYLFSNLSFSAVQGSCQGFSYGENSV